MNELFDSDSQGQVGGRGGEKKNASFRAFMLKLCSAVAIVAVVVSA